MVGAEADVRLKMEAVGREVEEREVDAEAEAAVAAIKFSLGDGSTRVR